MPTVLRIEKYRFHFYSDEGNEPPYIHVEDDNGECKYWLKPSIILARNKGIKPADLTKIERLVYLNKEFLLEKYYEFHSKK
ncbi:MAG: DUF4160 domain-containing protein [bacterium]